MTNIPEETRSILDALGDSAEQVAAALNTRAIKGTRNTVRMLNPIVRYVGVALSLTCRSMDVMLPGILRIQLPDGKLIQVDMPVPVMEFLQAFDDGKFPFLENSQ